MGNHFCVFDNFAHHVFAVESFGGLDLVKQKVPETFFLVVVSPDVCSNFPKNINIDRQIGMTLLYFLDDGIDFCRVKVVIPDHDQDEELKYPYLVLVLDFT